MSKSALRIMHENDVESCKKWLCDSAPITVRRGLGYIVSLSSLYGRLYDGQISNLLSKLMRRKIFAGISVTTEHGIVNVDDIVTIEPFDFEPDLSDHSIRSRLKFVKLIYQYLSYFPVALSEAYKEITGESLILDDLSVVRECYKKCSAFDSWSGQQLCAFISHCDPEALDFMSENPEDVLYTQFTPIFSRSDLYKENLQLVKAAIHGGVFELIHLDRENWEKSTLKPKNGLEWAKNKGIDYHPVLDEYLLILEATPVIASGYTTPYLDMMQEVIRELEISKEHQGKKEAIAASFAKKLVDHKLTPPSQKLADAMATLVRLPVSQQGRAKHKE
jgi:hypothetical protein